MEPQKISNIRKFVKINSYKNEYSEGRIEFYKNIFPMLFDNDGEYNIFVDYYNKHEKEH